MKERYARIGAILARYWRAYGGWGELFRSPYFHLAALVSALSYFWWSNANWWELVLSVLPNLLGFTLGGYALLVAFLGEGFRGEISGPSVGPDGKEKESPFIQVNATFVHFILIQILALIFATVSKTASAGDHSLLALTSRVLHVPASVLGSLAIVFWGVSFFLFSYALTLLVAAVLAVFRVGTWLDKRAKAVNEQPEEFDAEAAMSRLKSDLQAMLLAEQHRAELLNARRLSAEHEAERLNAEHLKAEQEVERLKAAETAAEHTRAEHEAGVKDIQSEMEALAAAESEAEEQRQRTR